MRLFIALECPDSTKAELEKSAALLRDACIGMMFPPRENYHITLVFLGEIPTDHAGKITHAMDSCVCRPIPITIGQFGRFRRDGGDIFWRAIQAPEGLAQLQQSLSKALAAEGFSPEAEKEFKPHLTLAKQAVMREGVQLSGLSEMLPDLAFTATFMTLMCSQRIGGNLTYTPIHRTHFRE